MLAIRRIAVQIAKSAPESVFSFRADKNFPCLIRTNNMTAEKKPATTQTYYSNAVTVHDCVRFSALCPAL